MRKRTKLAAGAGAAIAAMGAGGAVAADRLSPQEESNAVVEDAAGQLGVSPERLTAALQKALENRIDEAVEDGRITEEHAAELKERLGSGVLPLLGPLHKAAHEGVRHLRLALDTAAGYLGVTRAELRAALREGESLADVAKAEGKSVDGLTKALVQAGTDRLDEALADGKITPAQRDAMAELLEERADEIVNGSLRDFGFRGRHGSGGPGHGEPPPGDA